jgi:hypothetical protein
MFFFKYKDYVVFNNKILNNHALSNSLISDFFLKKETIC